MVKPIGNETHNAIMVVRIVPEISGIIPKCFLANRGVHCLSVRNSKIETSLKKLILSLKRTQIIPIVVSIVTKAVSFKKNSIIFSLYFLIIARKAIPQQNTKLLY